MPDLFGKKHSAHIKATGVTSSARVDGSRKQRTNSTEDLFNMISQTKTKNTLLEPLNFQSRLKEGPQPAEEAIGSGLHRMRKTEYNVGFA